MILTKTINIFILLIIIILGILGILGILVFGFYYNSGNPDKSSIEPFSFYTCYMKLYDINPQFTSNYLKLNNKDPKCGPCAGSTLKVRVEPCNNDNCNPTVKLYSSQGMYIPYDKSITPTDVRNFFCL